MTLDRPANDTTMVPNSTIVLRASISKRMLPTRCTTPSRPAAIDVVDET
jgi:hypothetical protein